MRVALNRHRFRRRIELCAKLIEYCLEPVYKGGPYFKILVNYTETGLNLFVFNKKLYMQNISEKN